MYIITAAEHIKALEGLDEGSELGRRSGKNSKEIIICFSKLSDAENWLKNVEQNWCPATEKLESVRASWYEIWSYPDNSKNPDVEENFCSAWTRFGTRMSSTWTPDYHEVLKAEKVFMGDKLCKEGLVSVEMPIEEMVEMVTEVAENAMIRVLKNYGWKIEKKTNKQKGAG